MADRRKKLLWRGGGGGFAFSVEHNTPAAREAAAEQCALAASRGGAGAGRAAAGGGASARTYLCWDKVPGLIGHFNAAVRSLGAAAPPKLVLGAMNAHAEGAIEGLERKHVSERLRKRAKGVA